MKGFKGFDKELKCRGFQYEVGKIYEESSPLVICSNGFHFCEKIENVYGYYGRTSDTRICEVEALGEIVTEDDKSCTNKIRIVREISGKKLIDAILKGNNSGNRNSGDHNSGDYNSGYRNSGDYNSGYRNSGDYNSGNYNSGNYNSGYRNSGYRNSGNRNSGNRNSGNRNSGNYNSGDYNSGDYNSGNYNSGDYNSGNYNSGDYNSGHFNSNAPFVRLFNHGTKLRWDSDEIGRLNSILGKVKPILRWITSEYMTDEEKEKFPSHKTTGGFLKNTGRNDWSNVSKEDFDFIKSLPNFDAQIFESCTGVDLK